MILKKSGYLDDDDDDKKYKGIRDLEYMFEDVNENDEDYTGQQNFVIKMLLGNGHMFLG